MPESTTNAAAAKPTSRHRRLTRFLLRWVWRSTKLLALLVLLTLPAAIGWVSWTNYQGQKAIEDAVQTMIEQGDLPPEHIAIPAEENGARYLRAAATLMFESDELREDWPTVGTADWPEFGVSLEADQIETLAEMVELSREGYAMVEAARAYKAFDFDPEKVLTLEQKLDLFGDTRRLTRWLAIHHLHLIAQDQPHEAAETVGDVLLLAQALRRDDIALASIVNLSTTAFGYSMVEESLSLYEYPDEALLRMQIALMTAVGEWDSLDLMKRETQRDLVKWLDPDEAMSHTFSQSVYISDALEEFIKQVHEEILGTPYELVEAWWYDWVYRADLALQWLCPGTTQLYIAKEYEYLTQALEQVENQGQVDTALLDQADESGYLTPRSVLYTLQTFRKATTELNCHIYGLEAERYRLKNGTWPTSIEQIEIADLQPIDAWGNRLKIIKTDQEFKVYSFGENQQDEGGLDQWDDYPNGGPDDRNMTLLDPEVRGTLTPEVQEPFEYFGEYGNESNGYAE